MPSILVVFFAVHFDFLKDFYFFFLTVYYLSSTFASSITLNLAVENESVTKKSDSLALFTPRPLPVCRRDSAARHVLLHPSPQVIMP